MNVHKPRSLFHYKTGTRHILRVLDCAGEFISGMQDINGEIVQIIRELEPGRYEVECPDGLPHEVFEDELTPTQCDQHTSPEFVVGERILAMADFREAHQGHNYRVGDTSASGLILVERFEPRTNEWNILKGWYDPACFRHGEEP